MAELTSDPRDPRLGHGVDTEPTAQHEAYLVLSEEERARGFVAPLRSAYRHVGPRRVNGKETERECGAETHMRGSGLRETYAARPSFYGATMCVACQMHLPVGSPESGGEFVWLDDYGQEDFPRWWVGTMPPEEPCPECGKVGGFDGHVCEETPGYVAKGATPGMTTFRGFGEPPVPDVSPERESIWTPERESSETKLWEPEPPTLKVLVGGAETEVPVSERLHAWAAERVEHMTVAVSGSGDLPSQVRRWWMFVGCSGAFGAAVGLGIGWWVS